MPAVRGAPGQADVAADAAAPARAGGLRPTAQNARDLTAILFGGGYRMPRVRPATAVAAERLVGLVGRHVLAAGFLLAIARAGKRRYSQATGQPRVEIIAERESEFVFG